MAQSYDYIEDCPNAPTWVDREAYVYLGRSQVTAGNIAGAPIVAGTAYCCECGFFGSADCFAGSPRGAPGAPGHTV